ncbi:MAG: transposase [Methyloglobulus sp.]
MAVYVLNPRDTRHYMLGLGRRSKTDRVDATMIRRMVMAEHAQLRPYQPALEAHRQLALLQRRRGTVVKHRQALHKALRQVDTPSRLPRPWPRWMAYWRILTNTCKPSSTPRKHWLPMPAPPQNYSGHWQTNLDPIGDLIQPGKVSQQRCRRGLSEF